MSETIRNAFIAGGAAAGLVAAVDAGNLYARSGRFSGLRQEEITFPDDLFRTTGTPYMSMQFSAYRRRSIYEQPSYNSQMKIALPIPDGLIEQTSVSYDKASLGSVAGSVVETVSQGMPTSFRDLGTQLGTVAAGAGASAIQNLATAAPNALNALSAISGITANPFQTVLFKSPEFRSHVFRWKFAPETEDETARLRDLINIFKYHSLPGISAASGVFFSYPEILEINFRPTDEFLYKFKPCVVESITVNFTPGNGPSFYRSTNGPTGIQVELRVQEIEIWTKADYLRDASGRFNNPTANFR
jgi:hypothetical protein